MKYDPHELQGFLDQLSFEGSVGPFLVLADWLQAHGDPWGELIAFQCAGEQVDTTSELREGVNDHKNAVCALHRETDRWVSFERGFVRSVTFYGGDPDRVERELVELFDSPASAFLSSITFAWFADEHLPALERVAGRLRDTASVTFDDPAFTPATYELRAWILGTHTSEPDRPRRPAMRRDDDD